MHSTAAMTVTMFMQRPGKGRQQNASAVPAISQPTLINRMKPRAFTRQNWHPERVTQNQRDQCGGLPGARY